MPLRPFSSADDARTPEHDAIKSDSAPLLSSLAGGSSSRRGTAGGGSVRVLVVDDHADMLSMMQLMMSRQSLIVETALSGPQALAKARDLCPHIVVSDIGMPDMDGLEMMRAMRLDNALSPFKSIALTGFGLPGDRDEAHAAGYDVCFTKPVDFTKLFERIDDLVAALSVEAMARRDIKLEGASGIDQGTSSLI